MRLTRSVVVVALVAVVSVVSVVSVAVHHDAHNDANRKAGHHNPEAKLRSHK
jgi:hypothetical protein